jgi:hypothetical protein
MNMECLLDCYWQGGGEPWSTHKSTIPLAVYPHNPTWTVLGSNPDLRGEVPLAYSRSQSKALPVVSHVNCWISQMKILTKTLRFPCCWATQSRWTPAVPPIACLRRRFTLRAVRVSDSPPVCLHYASNSAIAGWIVMKFDTGTFYENICWAVPVLV